MWNGLMGPIAIRGTERAVAALVLGAALVSSTRLSAITPPSTTGRTTISLDGIWQIAEGNFDTIPTRFDRRVPVPGLVDMAQPGFTDPGPKVADRQAWRQKDPRRDAFWYRRTFEMSGPIPAVAELEIGKAMFGTRVYLNGIQIGDHMPSFTPGHFDVRSAIKVGLNVLVVRVGADRDAVIGRAESGFDSEKSRYIPGIFDSVRLIFSGLPHILNVQVAPDIEKQSADIHVSLQYSKTPETERLHVTVREASTGVLAGAANLDIPAPAQGEQSDAVLSLPIRNCHLWSPEDPFLYELVIEGSGDSFSTRFGMRTFRLDPATGHAVLNGKPYFLRGTNITLYRFFEDPLRGDQPWRDEWVHRYFKSLKSMHWNAARVSIGFLPEAWYRIADQEGILLQDEFPIWTGDRKNLHNGDELGGELREWMEERWNHPSVVIWDAANETVDPVIARAVRQVRALDFSNRPWDDGWNVPGDRGDSNEVHPYHFIFGPDQPFRMYKLARDPGTKEGLLISQPFSEQKTEWPNAMIINEYGGLWLNRDGTPTTLSKGNYEYLLMKPSVTPEERRELYARDMAAITEFFRVHRKAAAVLEFSGLDYSRPDGQTSDDFTDIERLTRDHWFNLYVRDAFSPVGLMVDSWAEEYPADSMHDFPVLLVNDLEQDWKGEVRFRLLRNEKVLVERIAPATIAGFGTGRIDFSIPIPAQPAQYRIEATLLNTLEGPVSSVRDFYILTPEQRESRRNLALHQPAQSSSAKDDSTGAGEAVDGNGDTYWTPINAQAQWIEVDLGKSETISHALVDWSWAAFPESFSIEVSNDEKLWKTAAVVTQGDGPIQVVWFPPSLIRWVRLKVPESHKDIAYSLGEFEMYH
jgi:beta-galactosidase